MVMTNVMGRLPGILLKVDHSAVQIAFSVDLDEYRE